jgi:Winged helix DNA-binding domain
MRALTHADIAARRLVNQRVTRAALRRPADVVQWSGAMQAQEYEPAKWAIGLRTHDRTADPDVEQAFTDGAILRTHVMRPTWHFVAAADIRWMLELTAPRVHRALSSYCRHVGLDARTCVRATSIVERALGGGQFLTRAELGARLRAAGISLQLMPLSFVSLYAELEAVICSGPRRGKQFTYALVAERAPKAERLSRDEALATLTARFFKSHGPATIRDFVWWSGLTTADARRGLDINKARRFDVDDHSYWTIGAATGAATHDHRAHLLPIYDEYVVAYRDRAAVPHGPSTIRSGSAKPVIFQHALVVDGQIAGTWRVARTAQPLRVDVTLLRPLTRPERRAVAEAVERYGRFLSVAMDCSMP